MLTTNLAIVAPVTEADDRAAREAVWQQVTERIVPQMKIDLSKLLKGLETLPHTPTPEPENVPPYVLTHILVPLKNDDCIRFADLDFEAFTEEDIDSLYGALSETEDREHRLNHLRSTFDHSNPKAAAQRKFC